MMNFVSCSVKVVPLYLTIYPLRQFRPRVTIINSQMEKTDGRNHEEKKTAQP